jgi:Fe2+ transport system protein FeoA
MDNPKTLKLPELQAGQQAKIIQVEGDDSLAQRLCDMGIWPKVTIGLIRKAPLGDPAEYSLHGYRLALRREEAVRVSVRLTGAQEE